MTVGYPNKYQERTKRKGSSRRRRNASSDVETSLKRWLICVLVLALAGCDSGSVEPRGAVATVSGQEITAEAFEEALTLRRANLAPELLARPEVQWALEERVLEDLITRHLLLQEAARRGISSSQEAVERRLKVLAEGYSSAEYEAMLAERGHSLQSFRASLAEDLAIERLLEEVVGRPEPPKPGVVKTYYMSHKGELHRPVRARTLHLVVSTADEAKSVREAILAGGDFAETARRRSLGPEAVRNGELGWVSPGQMPEAFDEAIFSLQPGEVSPVVASPYGYHLFKLVEMVPAGVPSLEEARSEIVALLGGEAHEARYRQWVAELRARTTVIVHPTVGGPRR